MVDGGVTITLVVPMEDGPPGVVQLHLVIDELHPDDPRRPGDLLTYPADASPLVTAKVLSKVVVALAQANPWIIDELDAWGEREAGNS